MDTRPTNPSAVADAVVGLGQRPRRKGTDAATLALAVTLALIAGHAGALPGRSDSILQVPLGCAISIGKVIVITNSTGGAIDAGTKMGYDAVRPDKRHYGNAFAGPALARGASFQIDAQPSVSCTAWYIRPLRMKAP